LCVAVFSPTIDDDDVSESRVRDQLRAAPAHVASYVDRTTLAVPPVAHRESVGLGVEGGTVGVVGVKYVGTEVPLTQAVERSENAVGVGRRCPSAYTPPVARQVTVWESLWWTVVALGDDALGGVDDDRTDLVSDAQRPLTD
jgi:hypothetical protein